MDGKMQEGVREKKRGPAVWLKMLTSRRLRLHQSESASKSENGEKQS